MIQSFSLLFFIEFIARPKRACLLVFILTHRAHARKAIGGLQRNTKLVVCALFLSRQRAFSTVVV